MTPRALGHRRQLNVLSGVDPDAIRGCVELSLDSSPSWKAPDEYLVDDVSVTVANIVLGHRLLPGPTQSETRTEAGEGATVAP
jgi:hypothetical protein